MGHARVQVEKQALEVLLEITKQKFFGWLCPRRGLELVLENDWKDIWLEGDTKLVEIIMKKRKVRCMEVQNHISHINSILLPEFKNCFVSHIYREGNRAADKFAQMGHQLVEPKIWRGVPPDEVLAIVLEDAQGKIVLRRKG
jgi:hypothetical protein